jgi:hypothetical protein
MDLTYPEVADLAAATNRSRLVTSGVVDAIFAEADRRAIHIRYIYLAFNGVAQDDILTTIEDAMQAAELLQSLAKHQQDR